MNIEFPFEDSANYTNLEPTKTEITGGVATLKLVDDPGQLFTLDFASDTGFTYNSANTSIGAGQLLQIDQRPSNSIVGATYTSSLNANWAADGFASLAANLNGTPTLSSGKLSCVGTQGLYYSDTLIGGLSGDWVSKFKYTPNYTTAPGTNVNLFTLSQSSGTTDQVVIFHSPSGNSLRITANGLSAITFGTWTPTAGVEYTFEVICISNQVSLYVDNVQIGSAQTITPSQGTSSVRAWLGAYTGLYNTADGSFDDFILYSTALQTPTYTVPEAAYLADMITSPELEYTGLGTLIFFDSFVSTQTGEPRYTLQIGRSGTYLYWDGAAWVASNNTYSQANDYATFAANVSTLPVIGEIYGQYRIFTPDTNTQVTIDELVSSLTAQAYPTDNPAIEINLKFYIEGLLNFVETFGIKTGNDEIKYILLKGTDWYYWDGAAWSISDETYAQSSTAAEVLTNVATFTTTPGLFGVRFFLHSDDSTTTPTLDNLLIGFNFFGPQPEGEVLITVWGDFFEVSNTYDSFDVYLAEDMWKYKTNGNARQYVKTVTANIAGGANRWEVDLLETDNMPSDAMYVWNFKKDGVVTKRFMSKVQNDSSGSVNFNSLNMLQEIDWWC